MAEQQRPTDAVKSYFPDNGPSTSQVIAVVTLFPIGGILLSIAALIFIGTLFGVAVSIPVFLLFSPIIVPAVITIGLAVAGFLTSGVFGITALSSVTWIINYFMKMRGSWHEQFDQARRCVGDTAGHVGQMVRELGQKAQDAAWT
ncbi:oleosin H2-like [Salvia miltiorrhiza]|uniref:oleosin H2-like n=1 Tax=Salvia miltiorrhiza TaxID=226208 RepID=UPI0025ACC01A|nr:oleosin H2-like [Salvia miltiorrhiza]